MATLDRPEVLSLPPAATPSSPLDNDHHDRIVLPVFDSNIGSYAPTQHPNQNESQISFQQPLIQARNPFGGGDTASIAPSIATSNPPNYTRATRYHGHSSEEEYLAALRAWAEEKQYVQLDKNALHGFYGHEELQERAQRMTKERRAAKEMKVRMKAERRGTVAAPEGEGSASAGAGAAAAAAAGGSGSGGGRRRGSVANFFRRQSNAV